MTDRPAAILPAAADRRKPCPGRAGFTLLELLVAMAVFAVLAATAYGGLHSLLVSRERAETELAELGRLQLFFTLLERDLLQLVARPQPDQYGDLTPALSWQPAEQVLTFSRDGWPNPGNVRRSSLLRVRYQLAAGSLRRSQYHALDRQPDLAPAQGRELLDGVSRLQLRFQEQEGGVLLEEWPPPSLAQEAAMTALPRAVEVTIDTEAWGRLRRLMVLRP